MLNSLLFIGYTAVRYAIFIEDKMTLSPIYNEAEAEKYIIALQNNNRRIINNGVKNKALLS